MKKLILTIVALMTFIASSAQNLKVLNVSLSDTNGGVEFPADLNGNKCGMVVLNLANDNVTFEGNVIGTPTHADGSYQVFLAPNSRYLNIKYPGENPVMVRFSDFDIKNLPSERILKIEMKEPEGSILAQLNSNTESVSEEAEKYYQAGVELISANNYVKAFEYLTKAYELKHPKAAYQLGLIYSDPYHAARMMKLVNTFAHIPKLPVKRDLAKAFAYYKESADSGYVAAQFAVGKCYENGNGVKKNKEEAQRWYEMAAEEGHLEAKEKLGADVKKQRIMFAVMGYGTSKNEFLPTGMKCDASDLSAISNGRLDENGQYCALIKVLMPFDSVSFKGQIVGEPLFKTNEYWVYVPQGAKELTIEYPDFTPLQVKFRGLDVDRIIGKNTYILTISFPIDLLKADDALSAEVCYNIGMGFKDRRDNQYIRWMTKAAELNYIKAKCALGMGYLYGMGVKRDANKAKPYLEAASSEGSAEASYYLGAYYELKHNYIKAQKYFKLAKEQADKLVSEE